MRQCTIFSVPFLIMALTPPPLRPHELLWIRQLSSTRSPLCNVASIPPPSPGLELLMIMQLVKVGTPPPAGGLFVMRTPPFIEYSMTQLFKNDTGELSTNQMPCHPTAVLVVVK